MSGFYKVADREGRTSTYTYAESKIVLLGEIDILVSPKCRQSGLDGGSMGRRTSLTLSMAFSQDHATGIKHTVIPGDFVYLPIGSSVDVSVPAAIRYKVARGSSRCSTSADKRRHLMFAVFFC